LNITFVAVLLFNDAKRVRYLFIRHLRDNVPTLLSRINRGAIARGNLMTGAT